MAAPDRSDSATALAHTPLFAHLGQLDLARLAGELEELHFQSGQAIVQEGRRGRRLLRHEGRSNRRGRWWSVGGPRAPHHPGIILESIFRIVVLLLSVPIW